MVVTHILSSEEKVKGGGLLGESRREDIRFKTGLKDFPTRHAFVDLKEISFVKNNI
jgi:hypothetical protein